MSRNNAKTASIKSQRQGTIVFKNMCFSIYEGRKEGGGRGVKETRKSRIQKEESRPRMCLVQSIKLFPSSFLLLL